MADRSVPATSRRATLGTCAGVHFVHDGFSDALYLLLPLWQAEFALTLTQVGVMKSLYSGAMALFQVPAGLLAERWGERKLLAMGTVLTGLAYMTLGLVEGHIALLLTLLVAGAGSAVQHPLSSSVVSKAYEPHVRRAALGIYNFSGDVGKVVIPLAVSVLIAGAGWRVGTASAGALGVAAGIAAFLVLRRLAVGSPPKPVDAAPLIESESEPKSDTESRTGWGITDRFGFGVLSAIGFIDGAGRTGFLTFLPFLLIDLGAGVETIGVALALVFSGGAAGKFVCGFLAQKFGVIRIVVLTELITGGGILLLLFLPLEGALALLPIIGLGLNGTSSVLYGTVSDFVTEARRARGFGLFYTVAIGGGAAAPMVFGMVSDSFGVTFALSAVAVLALSTIPLCALLVRPLARL
jgi:MFS family permease